MKDQVKSIKEHVARAKAYAGRMDVVRTLGSLCEALEELSQGQVVGREKFEIEIFLDEVLRTLSGMEQLSSIFPGGISFKRGQEKVLHARLKKVHDAIQDAIEKAEQDKRRGYKNQIDKFILAGQKLLDEKQPLEARKVFRKASEQFESEYGIHQDIGARLMRAGLYPESVEYLEKAIELWPRDPRPYGHLVTSLEALGELERAEQATREALKNFGPSDRVYLRMAKIYVKMRKWDQAYDAARSAQDQNPFSREAEKIMNSVGPRIFSKNG